VNTQIRKRLGLLIAATLSVAAALSLSSCAQDAKITAPRYALVYGVQNYQADALSYPLADARGMRSALLSMGVSSADIIEREDSAVTKAQIRADILGKNSVSSDSTVIIYFSGHGSYVDSGWGYPYFPAYSGPYFDPYDAVSSLGIEISTMPYLVSPSELESWISEMGTKNVIVLLDTCFSGGFVSSGSAVDSSPQYYASMPSYSAFSAAMVKFGNLLVQNASASGSKTPIVISAAGSLESCIETSGLSHGVFTYYLIEAATKGDSDGDGYVTATEAYAYAAQGVKSWDLFYGYSSAFLPHISGDTRDLVLFCD
jgi:uncharacterized caspase-like protein